MVSEDLFLAFFPLHSLLNSGFLPLSLYHRPTSFLWFSLQGIYAILFLNCFDNTLQHRTLCSTIQINSAPWEFFSGVTPSVWIDTGQVWQPLVPSDCFLSLQHGTSALRVSDLGPSILDLTCLGKNSHHINRGLTGEWRPSCIKCASAWNRASATWDWVRQ